MKENLKAPVNGLTFSEAVELTFSQATEHILKSIIGQAVAFCPKCKGTGKMFGQKCQSCRGHGYARNAQEERKGFRSTKHRQNKG